MIKKKKRKTIEKELDTEMVSAFSHLFVSTQTKAQKIQEKLKKVQQELSEQEFQISGTFERMIGKEKTKPKATINNNKKPQVIERDTTYDRTHRN